MPMVARIAAILSEKFMRGKIEDIDPATLNPESDILAAVEALDIELSDNERAFLEAVPEAQKQAIQAALYSAVNREQRMPVMFAWIPGYDFELRIFEARQNGGATSMTIIFASPYGRALAG